MNALQTFQRALAKVLGVICATLFAILVLDVIWGVLTRHGESLNGVLDAVWAFLMFLSADPPEFFLRFPLQPTWTEELARFLLVWLAVLGGVLAYAGSHHLGVDVLVSRLRPLDRRISLLVSHLAVLGFAVSVLVIGGMNLFLDRWQFGQTMPAMGIPKAWLYLVIPLGGIQIALLAMAKMMASIWQPLDDLPSSGQSFGKEDAQ